MELPQRKHPRLKKYNYSENGCYFITICTQGRRSILAKISDTADNSTPPAVTLTRFGEITEHFIHNIDKVYSCVIVDKYVIMPNHIHMIIVINKANNETTSTSIPTIVRSLKRMTTREIGSGIWQDSYYDHVIRNEASYKEIWTYIDENPQKWLSDKYYSSE